MLLSEVIEVIDYLNEHPTTAEILAAVYEVKTTITTSRPVDQKSFEEAFRQLPQMIGQIPESAPDDFKENFKWAEEQMKMMHLKNKIN